MTTGNSIKDVLFEDAAGMAGSQLLALAVGAIAGVAWGGAISIGLVLLAPMMSIYLAGRYRPY